MKTFTTIGLAALSIAIYCCVPRRGPGSFDYRSAQRTGRR